MVEADGWAYWLQWQVFVSAAILLSAAAGAALMLPRARLSTEPLLAADLWAPCWSGLHPLWLLGYRALALVVMVAVLLRFSLSIGVSAFYFYTQWTFLLVIAYFLIATIVSARGCWAFSKKSSVKFEETTEFLDDVAMRSSLISGINKNGGVSNGINYYKLIENDRPADLLGKFMQVVYQTCAGASMLTDVTFWGLLVPVFYRDTFTIDMATDGMHSLNIIFLLIDTSLNNMPFPWYRMAYFVLWSCSYITFQWVVHACGLSWWAYPFLELSTPLAPMWYLGMALVHVPCYCLYWLIVKAKKTHFLRLFPNSYVELY